MLENIKLLSSLPGVSGDETAVANEIVRQAREYSTVSRDRLGNVIARKEGAKGPRVIVAAHMDEVGLMVTFIEDNGYLRFGCVGGIDPRVLLGQRVKVGRNALCGVIGTKAVHLQDKEERKKAPGLEKLFIDIGARSKQEAVEAGIVQGDYCVFDSGCYEFGDGFLKGKALDDRVGCALMLELLKKPCPADVTYAFTVQEEVGLRGAQTSAWGIRPQVAVVLETTTAADFGNVEKSERVCSLGGGPVITLMDGRTLYDRELTELAVQTAEKQKIPWQYKESAAGGNDAGAIQTSRYGAKVLAISVPCRNLHSPSCVIKISDVYHTLRLVQSLLEALEESI